MDTREFWVDALERAIKTGAQVTLPIIATATTAGALGAVNWTSSGVIIGGAVAASFLTSIISSRRGNPKSASLVE